MIDRKLRIDALPEDHPYQDEGCAYIAPSCLACPLTVCVYDHVLGVRPYVTRLRLDPRDARIRELSGEGRDAAFVAAEVGVSTRTVWRVMAA